MEAKGPKPVHTRIKSEVPGMKSRAGKGFSNRNQLGQCVLKGKCRLGRHLGSRVLVSQVFDPTSESGADNKMHHLRFGKK